MDSLHWVDRTYVQKHESEDPRHLRALYYPNLSLYGAREQHLSRREAMSALTAFLTRFAWRSGISLAVYFLSYLPLVGRSVLPAASFYAFQNAVGVPPALVIFSASIVVPKRYLVIFLQTYFSSRTLMRELVSCLHHCQTACFS